MVQTATNSGVLSSDICPDLASARQTLAREVEGLEALAQSLDDSFSHAVETIHRMKQKGRGRLIVAGIGKSGTRDGDYERIRGSSLKTCWALKPLDLMIGDPSTPPILHH